VLIGWAFCACAMLWLFRSDILTLAFRDPDDAMRLAQVRDWIGGQAFHDVSQHRVNPPLGGPMHWSRVVDMPIAGLILLLRPLLGQASAEMVALAIVPPLLLGGLVAATCRLCLRLADARVALIACAMLLTAPSVLVQFTPLRIDHHGWQTMLAAVALMGALDAKARRGGVVAGLAIALWLQISSEALPYAALFGAVLALRQWFAREEAARFTAYALALGGAALPLLIVLRGWDVAMGRQCDALSSVYALPLLGFAIATLLAARLLGTKSMRARFGVAAFGGGVAVVLFAGLGGPCLSGDPFAALGPIAYRIWYLQVMEGRPIWEQGLSMAGIILLPPVAGLIGSLMAARDMHGDPRARWLVLAMLLGGAMLVACLVLRALSVAHIFALPGIAWMVAKLMIRVRAMTVMPLRVAASVALALLTPVGLNMLWVALVPGSTEASPASVACRTPAAIAPLGKLPDAVLIAPLDLGPDILVRSGHSVIGTAHHRNAAGITAVIESYVGAPDKARAILMRLNGGRGPDYLVSCPGLNEQKSYAKENRFGLAAMLAAGKVPDWLRPVPMAGPLRLYRVVAPGVKDSATPFMQ
jgi:hypothetical protein